MSDGPATSTPSAAAPGRHTSAVATVAEDGPQGRAEGRTPVDPADNAAGGTRAMQMGSCAKFTQVDLAAWTKLVSLATDDEPETGPEDLYSQWD